MTNLAANARDAIDGIGTIFIETTNISVSQADAHMDLPKGVYILLAVRDTGMGIDPVTQEYIFEPFFTTKTDGSR